MDFCCCVAPHKTCGVCIICLFMHTHAVYMWVRCVMTDRWRLLGVFIDLCYTRCLLCKLLPSKKQAMSLTPIIHRRSAEIWNTHSVSANPIQSCCISPLPEETFFHMWEEQWISPGPRLFKLLRSLRGWDTIHIFRDPNTHVDKKKIFSFCVTQILH